MFYLNKLSNQGILDNIYPLDTSLWNVHSVRACCRGFIYIFLNIKKKWITKICNLPRDSQDLAYVKDIKELVYL